MRKLRFSICLVFLGLLISSAAFSDGSKKVTGMDWLQMSSDDRMQCVRDFMQNVSDHGVILEKISDDYYEALEEKLHSNPAAYKAGVDEILFSIVYETEPDSREALKLLKNEFKSAAQKTS